MLMRCSDSAPGAQIPAHGFLRCLDPCSWCSLDSQILVPGVHEMFRSLLLVLLVLLVFSMFSDLCSWCPDPAPGAHYVLRSPAVSVSDGLSRGQEPGWLPGSAAPAVGWVLTISLPKFLRSGNWAGFIHSLSWSPFQCQLPSQQWIVLQIVPADLWG